MTAPKAGPRSQSAFDWGDDEEEEEEGGDDVEEEDEDEEEFQLMPLHAPMQHAQAFCQPRATRPFLPVTRSGSKRKWVVVLWLFMMATM